MDDELLGEAEGDDVPVAPDGFSFAEGGSYACNECGLVLKGVGGCKKHAGTEKCRTKAETLKRKVSLLRARLRPASRTLRAGGQAAAGTQARQGVVCGGGCGGRGCSRGGRRQRHGASARLSLAAPTHSALRPGWKFSSGAPPPSTTDTCSECPTPPSGACAPTPSSLLLPSPLLLRSSRRPCCARSCASSPRWPPSPTTLCSSSTRSNG